MVIPVKWWYGSNHVTAVSDRGTQQLSGSVAAMSLTRSTTILDYTVLYLTIPYYTLLYLTTPYYTVLYCTILYYTVLYCGHAFTRSSHGYYPPPPPVPHAPT